MRKKGEVIELEGGMWGKRKNLDSNKTTTKKMKTFSLEVKVNNLTTHQIF